MTHQPSSAAPAAARMAGSQVRGARMYRPHLNMPPPVLGCVVVLAAIILAALAAPWLAVHDPTTPVLQDRLRPPVGLPGGSWTYPLGTDHVGYDLFVRVLYGARLSLGIAALAALVGTFTGVALGVLAGYLGGPLDWLISLAADTWLAIPFLVIALIAVAVFGTGTLTLVILIGVSGWVGLARTCRAQVLSLREREFVTAARALGIPEWRIVLRHILPNLTSLILVLLTIDLRGYILAEASLSFLGLGVQPPDPSWGDMINRGRAYLATAWWISLLPGAALLLTILSVSLIGDWLRDRLDPMYRR